MNRPFLFALLTTCVVSSSAFAQPRPVAGPVRSPSFSPYLNLARTNNSNTGLNPAINYFGIVRPGQQLAQQQSALAQQLQSNSQSIQGLSNASDMFAVTGRGAVFNNTSHYFNTMGGGASSGGGRSSFGGSVGTSGIGRLAGSGSIGSTPQRGAGGGGGRR